MEATIDSPRQRFVSIDALRGFDMFWILGADSLARALPLVSDNHLTRTVAEQLEHVPWAGFHFYDLIFPLFVFLVGVSTVFSLDRIVEQKGKEAAYWRIIRRSVILYVLGLFYHGGLSRDGGPEMFRLMGVLHRIAICYCIGGFLYLNMRLRGLIVVAAGLLIGYWALLSFVPVPGQENPSFDEGRNLANYIDAQYLGGYKWDGDWDPEGLLSTMGAVVSGLMGIFAGRLLRNQNMGNATRVFCFAVLGAAGIFAGYSWHVAPQYCCPVIKKLWTPSFVLYAAGWSFVLVAVFHAIIDLAKFDAWARPFVWIGMNPITLYMLANLIGGYGLLVHRVVHREWFEAMGYWGPLLVAVLESLIAIWFAWLLYKNKFFLRI